MRSPRKWFDRVVKDAKIEGRWHDLRDTFASRPRQESAKLDGTRSLSTSRLHAHLALKGLHDGGGAVGPRTYWVKPLQPGAEVSQLSVQ
jgi:hypothetical protein